MPSDAAAAGAVSTMARRLVGPLSLSTQLSGVRLRLKVRKFFLDLADSGI